LNENGESLSDVEFAAGPIERRDEFTGHLKSTRPRLLRFVMSLVGSMQDAEDILQKACLTMWKNFAAFTPETDFMAWASTVASFEVKNFRRSSGRSKVVFDGALVDVLQEESVQALRQYDSRLEALEECLHKLDDVSRSLVESVYSNGEEIKDIARREGRAVQTYYNRLNLVRRILADCTNRKLSIYPE
jgi:RNA polymerase sigma-70 factor (ECF subfamily)